MTEPLDNSQKFNRDICPARTPCHVGHVTPATIWRADRNSGPSTGQRQISRADAGWDHCSVNSFWPVFFGTALCEIRLTSVGRPVSPIGQLRLVWMAAARWSPEISPILRSALGEALLMYVSPRARRSHLMRTALSLMSTGVSSRPAELTQGVRNVRTKSAGVAVRGGCVPAVFTQLEFTMRGCSGPRLGPLSQNAGQVPACAGNDRVGRSCDSARRAGRK